MEKKKILDPKVYSSGQQWRLLGCHKKGKDNNKDFCEEWQYFGETIYHWTGGINPKLRKLQQLRDTLITMRYYDDVTKKEDDAFRPTEKKTMMKERANIDEASLDEAYEYICENNLLPDYEARKNQGNPKFLILDRIRSGYCSQCQRDHGGGDSKGDKGYLWVNSKGEIFFKCYRSEGKGELIGVISEQDKRTEEIERPIEDPIVEDEKKEAKQSPVMKKGKFPSKIPLSKSKRRRNTRSTKKTIPKRRITRIIHRDINGNLSRLPFSPTMKDRSARTSIRNTSNPSSMRFVIHKGNFPFPRICY